MAARTKVERRAERRKKLQEAKARTWQPKEEIVYMYVDNPYYSRAHNSEEDGDKTNPLRIIAAHNVRESAVSTMAARGHLSVAQVRAAKTFCSLWEALGGSGAGAIDYSRERVDGGRNPEALTEKQMRAGIELKKCADLLGVLGYELVSKVAGQGCALDDICANKRHKNYAADHLRGCLEVLAVHWGYSNAPIRAWVA